MTKNVHDHDDMVANIVDTYQRATTDQLFAGREWYRLAGRIVDAIAQQTETDPVRVTYALAALSPRNPWRWNVADAYSYAAARKAGMTMPRATTFKRNQLAAWRALDMDGQPWNSAAPKVQSFVAAIMGNPLSVVVDQWAYRVATTVAIKAIRPKVYAAVTAAYKEAARITGETPRDLQAITWLVAQTEGLASSRTGRHDLTFKAGTPEFVKELLS